MNAAVLKQAKARLAVAQKKASSLAHSRSAQEIRELWSEFLTEHYRLCNRLDNAMETSSEQGWFERATAARKNNALMSYLLHARNADEHGRAEITYLSEPGFSVGDAGSRIYIKEEMINPNGFSRFHATDLTTGKPAPVHFYPEKAFPTGVQDRGKTYSPPLNYGNLAEMAATAVEYLASMLSEAEGLLTMSANQQIRQGAERTHG